MVSTIRPLPPDRKKRQRMADRGAQRLDLCCVSLKLIKITGDWTQQYCTWLVLVGCHYDCLHLLPTNLRHLGLQPRSGGAWDMLETRWGEARASRRWIIMLPMCFSLDGSAVRTVPNVRV